MKVASDKLPLCPRRRRDTLIRVNFHGVSTDRILVRITLLKIVDGGAPSSVYAP
jgi:hypothetical protein